MKGVKVDFDVGMGGGVVPSPRPPPCSQQEPKPTPNCGVLGWLRLPGGEKMGGGREKNE